MAGMFQSYPQVGGWHIGLRPVGPLDQADSRLGESIFQSCIEKFSRDIESIKIKVI